MLVCTSAMLFAIASLISSVSSWTSFKNLLATSNSASLGQLWNQSILVHEIIPGNFLARILKASPTGEKHRITCKLDLTLSMKNSKSCSLFSAFPAYLASFLMELNIPSNSSGENSPGMIPELNMSLISTRNLSSGIYTSVNKNAVGVPPPFTPAFMYIYWISVFKSDTE